MLPEMFAGSLKRVSIYSFNLYVAGQISIFLADFGHLSVLGFIVDME